MNLNPLHVLLAQASNAPAPGAPPPGTPMAPNPTGQMLNTLLLMGVMVFVLYFIMLRPQSKKAKELAEMMKTLKPGDKVVTSSGIVGVVVAVKERTVSIRSAETKLEVLKSTVSGITERAGESSSAEPKVSVS